MLLAYVGPETVMPIASVLAGALGLVLIAWKWLAAAGKKTLRYCAKINPARSRT